MIEQDIKEDTKAAMKQGNKPVVGTLRFLQAEIKNVAIEKGRELTDEDVLEVIARQVKRRQESIDQFAAGGRQDLVDKETAEMALLRAYLPPQLSREELTVIIKEAISETGASGPRDMGRVMGTVISRTKGRADGKLVSSIVKECLA